MRPGTPCSGPGPNIRQPRSKVASWVSGQRSEPIDPGRTALASTLRRRRVPQERLQTALARIPQEIVRLSYSHGHQNLSSAIPAQWVEPQQVNLFAIRDGGHLAEVAFSQPGFVATRKPEARSAQLLDPTQDLVQWLARVIVRGALFVQSVDEQGPPATSRELGRMNRRAVT